MLLYSQRRYAASAAALPSSTSDPYTITNRAAFAEAEAAAAPPSLSAAAVSAMTDPDGISPVFDASVEIESNRLRRATTVTLRRADTLAAVPVLDASTMDVQAIVDGRRNPTRRFCVADSSIADDCVAFDAVAGDGESRPVAFGDPVVLAALVPNATAAPGGAGWDSTLGTGAQVTLAPFAAVPDGDGNGYVWRVTSAAPFVAGRWIGPAAGVASYRHPAGVEREWTLTAGLRPIGGQLVAHYELTLVRANATTVVLTSSTFVVPASADLVRVAAQIAYTPGVVETWTGARWRLVVDAGTAATELRVDDAELYAGPDRGALVGLHAATPAPGAVVELTWTGVRRVNRVEVSGERRAGRITSARLDVLDDADGTWKTAGVAWGGGRLAVILDATYTARGVRLYVEESTGDPLGRAWVCEVDPMLVVDVSPDTASCRLVWRREAAPGAATIPVGNYQASEATLVLDNTSGDYTPAANAAIDTGHRVEIAVGVRYTNLLPNPRAELDLTGWRADAAVSTIAREGDEPRPVLRVKAGAATATAEHGDGIVAGQPVGVSTAAEGHPIGAAYTFRARLLANLTVSPTAVAGLVLYGLRADGTGGVIASVNGAAGKTGLVPLAVTATHAQLAGFERVIVRVTLAAATGNDALRVEALALDELDATLAPLAIEELVPGGVFYSDPWDAPSDSALVTIVANDRLGRYATASVSEPVRQNVDVRTLVRDLALTYLDLDDDQVAVASSSGSYVIPYAYAADTVGTYLADLAKATLATMYVDAVDRLALTPRDAVAPLPVIELRADNALIRHRKPSSVDTVASIVKVTASPLVAGPVEDLWTLETGLTLAVGESREVYAPYSSSPAVNAFLTGVAASGAYTVTASAFYATFATFTIRNDSGAVLALSTAIVRGTPLVASSLVARRVHQPSYDRYGPRELPVEAALVQTQAQLDVIADVLSDAFRGVDDNGNRRLPDVELDSLGLLHVDVSDRVVVVDPAIGLGSDYQLTGRELAYEQSGALFLLNATAREVNDVLFAIADVSIADDVYVAGY